MIGYFPDFYPDELIYSVLARYHATSGYIGYINSAEDLFIDPWVRPDVEFINAYKDDALKALTHNRTMSDIVENHTMFAYYARFLPHERRNNAFTALVGMKGNYHNLLKMPKGRQKYLRYCPICSADDRTRYGETYWHRIHQMPEIDICPVHGCKLYKSTVLIAGKTTPTLECAEDHAAETKVIKADSLSHDIARYTADVMQGRLDLSSQSQVHKLLHGWLEGTKYLSRRGAQRNITLLFEDFRGALNNISWNSIDEPWRLQKIFTGDRCGTADICLIAYFLGIPAADLIQMKQPKVKQVAEFDKSVIDLHEKGLSYPQIAQQLNASLETVKSVGSGKYKRLATGTKHNKGGVAPADWHKKDIETLPRIVDACKEIYSAERPKRVSVNAVELMLNLPQKSLNNMPLCYAEVEKYKETQLEYWAREVVWAARTVLESGDKWQWTSIRRLTNIRRVDLRNCFDLISADEELKERIRELL